MNKSTLLAVVVFAALAAAAVTTLRDRPQRGITRISFAAVDPAKVDRIVVSGSNAVELAREGEVWKVGRNPADAAAVKSLLEAVKSIESSEEVTRNAERFADLEVNDEKGTRVQAFSGGTAVADFVIGSSAGGGSNVRAGDAVYLVKKVYKGTFSRDRSLWLDRKIFAAGAADATRLTVKLRDQAPYTLIKDGEQWKLEDASLMPSGHRFDANAARGLVSSLTSLQAKDILDEDPGGAATGLDEHADTLTVEIAGSARTLQLGTRKDDASVYARASTRPELLTVAEGIARNLRKPLAELRDLSLMAFEPQQVKRLTIVKDKDRLVFEKQEGGTWKSTESTQSPPESFELDSMAVLRRISAIGSARAVAEAGNEPPAKTGLQKPQRKLELTLEDGRSVTLAFGAETRWDNADAVYAQGNADAKTYLVRTFTRDNLLGGIETFAKRDTGSSLAHIDPNALKNLPPEVRESLMKQIAEQKQKDQLMKAIMEQQQKKK